MLICLYNIYQIRYQNTKNYMPWIRIIKPEIELPILSTRCALTEEQFDFQQSRYPMPNEFVARINFTPVSSFSYIIEGASQKFFDDFKESSKVDFAIMIKDIDPSREIFFRSSEQGIVSEDIFARPSSKEDFQENLKAANFEKKSEKEVETIVRELWKKKLSDKNGNDVEFSDSKDLNYDSKLERNKGLFRYKVSDISGILLKNNERSIRNGMAFATLMEKEIRREVPIYMWNNSEFRLVRIDDKEIYPVLGYIKNNDGKIWMDRETKIKYDSFNSLFGETYRQI